MTAIVIIVCVTALLIAALVCSAITIRPVTPCRFDHTIAIVGEARIGDGGPCSKGKADNVYWSSDIRVVELNDSRVCDRHQGFMLDLADALKKETPFE